MENSLGVFLALTLLSSLFSLLILYNIFGKISFVDSVTQQRFSVKILNNKNSIEPRNFILLALLPIFNLAYTIMVMFTVEYGLLVTSLIVSALVILITGVFCAIYVFIPSYEGGITYFSLTRFFIFSPILFLFLPLLYMGLILHTLYNYYLVTNEDLQYNLLMLSMKDIEDIVYNSYRNNNEKAIKELNDIAKKLVKNYNLFTLDSEIGIKNNDNLNQVFYLSFFNPIDYTFTPEQLLILFERSKYLQDKCVQDDGLDLAFFGVLDVYEYMLTSRVEPVTDLNKELENYAKLEKLIAEFKQENLELIIRKELHEIKLDTIKSFKDFLQFPSNFEKKYKEKFENVKTILPEHASVDVFNNLIQELLNTKGFKDIIELPDGETLDKLVENDYLEISDIYDVFSSNRILYYTLNFYYGNLLPENLFGTEFIKSVDSRY